MIHEQNLRNAVKMLIGTFKKAGELEIVYSINCVPKNFCCIQNNGLRVIPSDFPACWPRVLLFALNELNLSGYYDSCSHGFSNSEWPHCKKYTSGLLSY